MSYQGVLIQVILAFILAPARAVLPQYRTGYDACNYEFPLALTSAGWGRKRLLRRAWSEGLQRLLGAEAGVGAHDKLGIARFGSPFSTEQRAENGADKA